MNEGPLGYTFPKYDERASRMKEALTIIRRLLDGEKLDFEGEFYNTKGAKLYSPPVSSVPIWLAAGGPKSSMLAAEYADGLMISVKNPEDAYERVINPAKTRTDELEKSKLRVHTYRWTMFADNDEDAWESLKSWRGLRAPNRLQEIDPQALREQADSLPKDEIMAKFSRAGTVDELVDIYSPLVNEFGSEIVTIQISSVNQEETIKLLGEELLPKLKK
jgi:coenzyme F420-dependent glucose-6-phosphate dehydrogenase